MAFEERSFNPDVRAGSVKGSGRQPRLVIGVGNWYRGDDGAGIAVARKLKRLGLGDVVALEASGEGFSLIEAWKGAGDVVIVDAVASGSTAGTIHRFDACDECVPTDFFQYSTHAFGVAEAIEVARTLNMLPQHLEVIGIEGGEFTTGVGLSPAVEQAVDAVIARITK